MEQWLPILLHLRKTALRRSIVAQERLLRARKSLPRRAGFSSAV